MRGTTEEGETFETEKVAYDAVDRVLRSETPVRVDRSNLRLRAEGMEIDVATRVLKLTGKVRAEIEGERG